MHLVWLLDFVFEGSTHHLMGMPTITPTQLALTLYEYGALKNHIRDAVRSLQWPNYDRPEKTMYLLKWAWGCVIAPKILRRAGIITTVPNRRVRGSNG
jgi:hypothetical protein